jgi:putative chitinase
LRIAHFLGQTCHESDGFRTLEEPATGAAYEGRAELGNRQKGDGRRYRGRGLIRLTGRANYREIGKALNVELEADPDRAAEPALSLLIACEFWKQHNINSHCDHDDLVMVTRKVDGAKSGLEERGAYTRKAKEALARIESIQLSGAVADERPILRRGSKGEVVGWLQRMLQKLKFPLAIDEDFGAATELAVMQFQVGLEISADGIVGAKTWDALEAAAASR